jgi:hypothetical protein
MLTEGGKNSLKIMKIFGENKARTVAPPPALAMRYRILAGMTDDLPALFETIIRAAADAIVGSESV